MPDARISVEQRRLGHDRIGGESGLVAATVGAKILAVDRGRGMVPAQLVYHQSWVPTVSSVGIGLLTALGAALIAARAATRVRPTEALAESSLQRRWLNWIRLTFALLCLGGVAFVAAYLPETKGLSVEEITRVFERSAASGTLTPSAGLSSETSGRSGSSTRSR